MSISIQQLHFRQKNILMGKVRFMNFKINGLNTRRNCLRTKILKFCEENTKEEDILKILKSLKLKHKKLLMK